MIRFTRAALVAAALAVTGTAVRADNPTPGRPVDLVLCLDTSNSMDGLIESAKLKLWDVVNELAKVKPTPVLRVGLYQYGNDNIPAATGWVQKEIDLTTDLDAVYAKLNGLKTRGGTEFVARVTKTALNDLKWSDDGKALKLIFVCGNESANQDKEVPLAGVAKLAKEKGVIVNTIYCGPANNPEAGGWKEFAVLGGGRYGNIDQNKSAAQQVVATPFDKELGTLSGKLNQTYLFYGKDAAEKKQNQVAQDNNAAKAAPGAAAARATTKAGALYRNETDLLDRMKADKSFKLKEVAEAELPEELKKLKPDEREGYLKKKAEERAAVQEQIVALSAKRSAFIAEELKKKPKSEADKAFDESLRATIRAQAKEKGFQVPAEKK